MYFIITVDTEADNQWERPSSEKLNNILFLNRFQELCNKFNFPVSYLITYEVANNDQSVKILKKFKSEGAEIGAHLHPWTTPPFLLDKDSERVMHRFPHELSEKELKLKLNNLTEIISKNFGKPLSYRSGRWGFSEMVAKELFNQGYWVDCSVTPKLSWKNTKGDPNKSGGPDYRRSLLKPHYIEGLFEIPLTVISTNPFFSDDGFVVSLYNLLPESFLKRVFNKIFLRVKTLRIFPETTKSDLEKIVLSAKRNRLPVIEFMIHSSELMSGGSKYAKTEESIEKIYKNLECLFEVVSKNNIKGITLTDYFKKQNI